MQEKKFYREEYPLEILSEFGLTEQMIYDLPSYVHDVIEMGGKSPLLPITIRQNFGKTHSYARFSLIETDEGVDVLFSPKLKSVDLSTFDDKTKRLLQEGKVLVATIKESYVTADQKEKTQQTLAFVQIDKDTNDVVYSPTQFIGRNLIHICNEYDLNYDDLQSLWEGELVTVSDPYGDEEELVTLGIDLLTDKGVAIVPGDARQWEKHIRRAMPDYHFGADGCWINKNGVLSYVPGKDFTPELLAVIEKRSVEAQTQLNHNTMHSGFDPKLRMEQERRRQFSM